MVLHLTDEAVSPSKEADYVISLHHYLGQYGQVEKSVYMHTDNHVGQNKKYQCAVYSVESTNWT